MVQRRLMSQEEILHPGDSSRPQTSPASFSKRLANAGHKTRPGRTSEYLPCTERSEESPLRSWQHYDNDNVRDSENLGLARCMTAGGSGSGSHPSCRVPGVVALDSFLPAGSFTAVQPKSHADIPAHNVSMSSPRQMRPGQTDHMNELRGNNSRASPPPTIPWACRPTPATAPSAPPGSAAVVWPTSLFGDSTAGEEFLSRSCTTAPHRLFSAWPDSPRRLHSRAATPALSSLQPQPDATYTKHTPGLEQAARSADPGLVVYEGAGEDLASQLEMGGTSTVMIQRGLAAAGNVMAHRRMLAPAGMSMLLATAQHHEDEELSVHAMEEWVANRRRQDLMPWAAQVVVRAWRRHVMRRRLLRFVRLRRKMRAIYLKPFMRAWVLYKNSSQRGARAHTRGAFEAWRSYCVDLQLLHKKVLLWTVATVKNWKDVHLTWQLCRKPGPETGGRLLSTMLVTILASEHTRRLKKARFEAWRALVRAATRRRRALGASMARLERRRLLRRIRPAFEFWKRLAFHKSAERAGVEPQQWHDNFQEWEEWVHHHRHRQWKHERAHRWHAGFLAKYFFYFWRFFRQRNQRLRAAWSFASRDRDLMLKWTTLIAFRMFRNIIRRERATQQATLRHWHAEIRNNAAQYQVTLSQLMVDRHKVKLAAFTAMREHAHALRAVRVASALQLAQRPLPALMAAAALLDLPHELWKLRVWRAWRGYAVRRLRLQVLAGMMVACPDALLLRRAVHAWLTAVSASQPAAHASRAGALDSPTPVAQQEPAGGAVQLPGVDTERGGVEGSVGLDCAAERSGQARAVPPRRVRLVSPLPPLWKEAMEKRVIMEALPAEERLSSLRLKKRMHTMLAVKPGHRETAMLPTTYQTEPTAADIELMHTGRKALHSFTQYPGGSLELWRLVVTARRRHVHVHEDPTLLTYAHTSPGITPVWTDFRERPAPGVWTVSEDEQDRVDSAFLQLHRPSLALLHRLAAAEDFLEAKAHALLGIGSESSATFYSHLAGLVRQRHGPLQVHALAALLAPLVEHDAALLTVQRRAWLQRDRMHATQVLLRHLAAAVHREQPRFTLVDPDGNDGTIWRASAMYEDSSSDEEGEGGASLYLLLPKESRRHYKPALRAFRRAHNRHSYIKHLRRRGVAVLDRQASTLATGGSSPVMVCESAYSTHTTAAAAERAVQQNELVEDSGPAEVDETEGLDGVVRLPFALAPEGAYSALSGIARSIDAGRVTGVAWGFELHAMLRVDHSSGEESCLPHRSQRFPSTMLEQLPSEVEDEEEPPLWQALSIAYTKSLLAQAAEQDALRAEASVERHGSFSSGIADGSDPAIQDLTSVITASSVPAMLATTSKDHQEPQAEDQLLADWLADGTETVPAAALPELPLPTAHELEPRAPDTHVPGNQQGGSEPPCGEESISVTDLAADDVEPPAATPAAGEPPRRLPGFEALKALLDDRCSQRTAPRRAQSARPMPGGGAGRARARRRARSAGNTGSDAGVKLRWLYDGVGHAVPELQQYELVELEAQTRQVAQAAVRQFAEEQRQQEQLQSEQVIPLESSGLAPMELAAALSHLSSQPSRLSREASLRSVASFPAPHTLTTAASGSAASLPARPATAAPFWQAPLPPVPELPPRIRPRPMTAPAATQQQPRSSGGPAAAASLPASAVSSAGGAIKRAVGSRGSPLVSACGNAVPLVPQAESVLPEPRVHAEPTLLDILPEALAPTSARTCGQTPRPSHASSTSGVVEAILSALPEHERLLFHRFSGNIQLPCTAAAPANDTGRSAAQHSADSQREANARVLVMLQQALQARARAAPASRAWTINMLLPRGRRAKGHGRTNRTAAAIAASPAPCEQTPADALRARTARVAAEALQLLSYPPRDKGTNLGTQSWQRVGGRMRVATRHAQLTAWRRRSLHGGDAMVLGVPAPKALRRKRAAVRVSVCASAPMKRIWEGVRRSLYPGAIHKQRGAWEAVQDRLNPRTCLPAFLRRGAGHVISAMAQPQSRRSNRASCCGSRGRQSTRRSSTQGHAAGQSVSVAVVHVRASVPGVDGGGAVRDSRMASGAYADGMHDGQAWQTPALGAPQALAARRKRGSYLFGNRKPCAADASKCEETRVASLSADRSRSHSSLAAQESLGGQKGTGERSKWQPDHAKAGMRMHDEELLAAVEADTRLWQAKGGKRGSNDREALQAAVSRAEKREEVAFELLAGTALDSLEQEFQRRLRHDGQAARAIEGGQVGDLRLMHDSAGRVPTNAEGSTLTASTRGHSAVSARAQPLGDVALQELAAMAAAKRRQRQGRIKCQQDALRRRQWREGGLDAAKEVLWAQAVVDLGAGPHGERAVAAQVARRPCTGAPVITDDRVHGQVAQPTGAATGSSRRLRPCGGSSAPRTCSPTPACSRSASPPRSCSRSRSPDAAPPSVQVAAASRSVLHAAACSPPVFNSAAAAHRAAPFTPPVACKTRPESSGAILAACASRAITSNVSGDAIAQQLLADAQQLGGAPHCCEGASSAQLAAQAVARSKVYASATMAPQVYVNWNRQHVEPGRLRHDLLQQASAHGSRPGMTGKSSARTVNPGGPLAALVPPEHTLHNNSGVGASGRPWRVDKRPINYSPVNMERFAQAYARQAKRFEAENQDAMKQAFVKRSTRKKPVS
eukprot:jgi/Ulvmu1/183/UM001_0187.1